MNNGAHIFIHSLFRAGSTYLFQVFRRAGYWCYQEPLHEIAVFARADAKLLLEYSSETMQLLFHPPMDKPYFQELYEVWPAWRDTLRESSAYTAYFAAPGEDLGISYLLALIKAARGRPVFQECRTSGRIGAIKAELGGYHIYLWRNPWDQWWSYKVVSYFDLVNQIIIHAPGAPEPVKLALQELKLEAYGQNDLKGAFAFYQARPLSSEQSFLVFYLLWCLGLKEGVTYADMLLNIDCLSDSEDYRAETLAMLKETGIGGLNFADCRVPQGCYLEKDQMFFLPLEGQVHRWLLGGGWTVHDLQKIQELRERFRPTSLGKCAGDVGQDLAKQAMRARMVALRFETDYARGLRQARAEVEKLNARSVQLQNAVAELTAAHEKERARSDWLEVEWNGAKRRIEELASVAAQREKQLAAVYASWSWKVTAPLRFGYGLALISLRLARKAFAFGRKALLWPLLSAMAWVLRDPLLAERINREILRYPWLHRRLRALAIGTGLMATPATPPPTASPPAAAGSTTTSDLAKLSPHARRMYVRLVQAQRCQEV